MEEETKSTGVNQSEQTKSQGRGRGMVKLTGKENSSSKEDNSGGSRSDIHISTEQLSKNKETKTRRMKAGFEVYQVKKRHAVVSNDKSPSPVKHQSPVKNQFHDSRSHSQDSRNNFNNSRNHSQDARNHSNDARNPSNDSRNHSNDARNHTNDARKNRQSGPQSKNYRNKPNSSQYVGTSSHYQKSQSHHQQKLKQSYQMHDGNKHERNNDFLIQPSSTNKEDWDMELETTPVTTATTPAIIETNQQERLSAIKDLNNDNINLKENFDSKLTEKLPITVSIDNQSTELCDNQSTEPCDSDTLSVNTKTIVDSTELPNTTPTEILNTTPTQRRRRPMSKSELKRKTNGQSLLECPCTYMSSEERYSCTYCEDDCKSPADVTNNNTPIVTSTCVVNTPVLSASAVTTLILSTPAVNIPVLSMPAITTPVLSTPAVTMPVLTMPAVTIPALSKSAVTAPVLSTPAVETPVLSAVTSAVNTPVASAPIEEINNKTKDISLDNTNVKVVNDTKKSTFNDENINKLKEDSYVAESLIVQSSSDAIDSKFLIASPTTSVDLHPFNKNDQSLNDKNNSVDPLSKSSHTDKINEINAMFTNVAMETKVNKEILGEDNLKFSSTSTMESESNETHSDEKDTRRGSLGKRNSNPDNLKKCRQRNFMSSIVSILNENKHYDEEHQHVIEKEVPRRYSHDRENKNNKNEKKKKDASSQHKQINRNNSEEKRKDKKQTNIRRNSKEKRRSLNLKQSTESDDSYVSDEKTTVKGGLIYLPETMTTTNTQDDKHVHYNDTNNMDRSTHKDQLSEYLGCIKENQTIIRKHLERGFESINGIKHMINASDVIQQRYGELIVVHQDAAFRNDYESLLWKTGFHNVILQFRKFLDDKTMESMQEIGKMYWQFLQNGIQFLDSLLLQIQDHNGVCLEDYVSDPVKMAACNKQTKLALRSCHLLLIFIGDLERYISQLQQDDSYKRAQDCYKQAQVLAPKNGKSYNQLAVVAVYTKRKVDAVYYYARSLQASNPILTAKDRLTAIFHEIKKKAGVYQQRQTIIDSSKSSSTPSNHPYSSTSNIYKADHLRDEVWIFYRHGQMFKVMVTNENEIIDLTPTNQIKANQAIKESKQLHISEEDRKVTLRKVNRGFIIHFLYIHCKLYTNIGLEDFTMLHQDTLSDLTTLLNYPQASTMKEDNLLKYIAINIFTIHNLIEKQGHDQVIPNTALDLAITFGMDMFNVICNYCVKAKDLYSCSAYLPCLRIWLRWMMNNSSLIIKSSASAMFDIWSSCCDLFNIINMNPVDVDIIINQDRNENVYLNEDMFLAGFKPLSPSLKFCKPHVDDTYKAIFQFRVNNMLELIVQLNQYGDLPFAYDEKDNFYKPIQPSVTSLSPVKTAKVVQVEDDVEASEEVILEDDDDDFIGDMSHISDLKSQKAALEKLLEDNERKRQAAISVIETHKSEGRHISENSPTYLVADTNCYIDNIDYIREIIDSKDFTLIVPLIVINELDGLKKGSIYDSTKFRHDYKRQIQSNASVAIDLLEDRFSQRDPNIRAITSSGNEMDTIVFRAEEYSNDRGTNDDVILSCCLKYCTEHISRTEGESSIVRRDVVLLTNDRNLRVKAHTRYVPTVNLTTFMKMARLL